MVVVVVINYTAFIELEKRQIILFIAPMIADWAVHLKPRNMATRKQQYYLLYHTLIAKVEGLALKTTRFTLVLDVADDVTVTLCLIKAT